MSLIALIACSAPLAAQDGDLASAMLAGAEDAQRSIRESPQFSSDAARCSAAYRLLSYVAGAEGNAAARAELTEQAEWWMAYVVERVGEAEANRLVNEERGQYMATQRESGDAAAVQAMEMNTGAFCSLHRYDLEEESAP